MKFDRRHFLSTAAMSLGIAELSIFGLINAPFVSNKHKEFVEAIVQKDKIKKPG